MTDFSYQLYSSRNFGPLPETLGMVAELGYAQVEAYGALFADETKLNELRAGLRATGLGMPTAHVGLDLVEGQPDRMVQLAREFGMEAVIVPHVRADGWGPAEWEGFAKRLAEAGKPIHDAGLAFGWHNHAFEYQALEDGSRPIDHILSVEGLLLEMDLAWVVKGGGDPIAEMERYGDRMIAAHIKDIAAEGECADEDGWADVGHGTMDWPALWAKLKGTKARVFAMEHDNPSDDRRFAERSLATAQEF